MSLFLLLISCSIERTPFIGSGGELYVAGSATSNDTQEDTSETSEPSEEDSAEESTNPPEDTSEQEDSGQ